MLWQEVIKTCYWTTVEGLTIKEFTRKTQKRTYSSNELYIFSLNLTNNEDFHFGQIMEGKVVDSITEEGV